MTSVSTKRDDRVLTVIINRPEVRNAVDNATAAALADVFREFESEDSLSVGVLCGNGDGFCSGADLKAVARGERNIPIEPNERLVHDGPMGPSRMVLKKPVIAAISGHAVAGGLELALWCDLRIAEADAVLGVFCRRWGVPLIDGGTVRLPRLIGLSHALDLILTGRPVDAEEALGMGLVNRVVPKGHARRAAEELAHEISKFPQRCLRTDRSSTYRSFDLSFEQAMLAEFRAGREVIDDEAIPGARQFADGKGRHGKFDDI